LSDVRTLCTIGSRRVGTDGNAAARTWLASALTGMGYSAETDPFPSTYPGNPEGVNLSVRIPGADSAGTIVIGAHFDTIEGIQGCEDNATGTAALLEIARRLAGQTPAMDTVLVFFDSEEYGHSGSEHYASKYSEETALMINLDCVGYGDELYAYSYAGAAGAVREYAIARAAAIGAGLTTHAGNETYPAGTTGPWSDHAPFERRGVDYLYLEGSNFAVPGAYGWGYTAEDPYVLHTVQDNMDYLLPKYGARMERHMSDAAAVAVDLALNGFTTGS
ncbi:MAG: M28 family peptidase, partial [Clostridia bacterium]|nr:M28 family peptidase [Clostridia bacterium]